MLMEGGNGLLRGGGGKGMGAKNTTCMVSTDECPIFIKILNRHQQPCSIFSVVRHRPCTASTEI